MKGPFAFKRMVDDLDEHVLLEFPNESNRVDPVNDSESQHTEKENADNREKEEIMVWTWYKYNSL